ncbi:hypothetical protein N7539_003009 [Penicillium diatomitis]|uniref:Protein BIG1 n=1 Tax=Penicillium diatomitis TaxID=2819901 RepID=A0A9X0BZQ8_9EURO|nr:uncharacterized protein N7539_003009 [Penicillium diatomitis]KAJ5491442.1 hypothetical protein N7539_003009 [Penicillium diatomitis]
MYLCNFGLLALGVTAVNAFRDTSPFFLASTSELLTTSANVKASASLFTDLTTALKSCPSEYYVIVNQPGVHSSDFATRKSVPRLGAKMLGKDKSVRSKMSVNEVSGLLEAKQIQEMLTEGCQAQTTVINGSSGQYPSSFETGPRVIVVEFPMLSLGSDRADQLSNNDGLIADIIDRIPSSSKYTLLYVTSPREFPETDSVVYESEDAYTDSVRVELKRDYSSHSSESRESNPDRTTSLFDKYQFFTPGIFMGFMASFLCLIILYIAINAISSLKVPYAAFEKDTSVAVQKKQQ